MTLVEWLKREKLSLKPLRRRESTVDSCGHAMAFMHDRDIDKINGESADIKRKSTKYTSKRQLHKVIAPAASV